MSLSVKKGSFAAELATGNKAYTGLGFQPKAIIFFASRATADGFAIHFSQTLGFVSDSAGRACSMCVDDAIVGAGNEVRRQDTGTTAFHVFNTGVATTASAANIVSFDSDGFTLNYTAANQAVIIHFIALGGSDIEEVFVGGFTETGVLGRQEITGVGFSPDLVLFASHYVNTTDALSSTAELAVGAACRDRDGGIRQASSVVRQGNNLTPTQVVSQQRPLKSIQHITSTSETQGTVGAVTEFTADGFVMNWEVVGATPIDAFLAIKGGSWFLGEDKQGVTTGNKSRVGVGFRPKGAFFFSVNQVESPLLDGTVMKHTLGGSDGTDEGAIWGQSTDNVGTSDANCGTWSTKSLVFASNPTPSIDAEADLTFDDDGYTLNWTTADAVARSFYALLFGDNPTETDGGSFRRAVDTFMHPLSLGAVALKFRSFIDAIRYEGTVTGSAEAEGAQTVSPSSTVQTRAFGTPTITTGSVTVLPSSTVHTRAFGTATVLTGAVTITPGSVVHTRAFGTAEVSNAGAPPSTHRDHYIGWQGKFGDRDRITPREGG